MRVKLLAAFILVFTGLVSAGHTSRSSGGGNDVENASSNYSVDIDIISKSCAGEDDSSSIKKGDFVTRESYPPQHEAHFNGTVMASNPCALLDYNVTRNGSNYTLNLLSQPSKGPCVECVGAIRYKAVFDITAVDFQLDILHNGEYMTSYSVPEQVGEEEIPEHPTPENETEPGQSPDQRNFLSRLMNWFKGWL